MKLKFMQDRTIQIDDARIIYRNFAGNPSQYNREGERNFAVLIDDEEMAEALQNDLNRYGVGWNVKIKAPREEGDSPFMFLPVKVKFNARGPKIYVESAGRRMTLDEETIGMLDDIDIRSIELDIRPYDNEVNGRPYRSAYLQSMYIVQEIDRFAARFAEEEFPEE